MYDSVERNLLRELTISQYKLKDQSSFFGLMWSFLNPLLMLVLLFGFFSRMGAGIEHYPIYLLIGLVLYTHFSNTTSLGMRALRATRNLTTDTVFPKEFLVLSTVLSTSVELVVSMAICLAIALLYGVAATPALLWLPAILVAELLLVTWVSFFLATVFPFAWDVDHVYHVFLRALLFITPIFYAEEYVGEGWARTLLYLNPLAWVVDMARASVLGGAEVSSVAYFAFVLVSAGLTWAGFVLFKKLEPRFAEHV